MGAGDAAHTTGCLVRHLRHPPYALLILLFLGLFLSDLVRSAGLVGWWKACLDDLGIFVQPLLGVMGDYWFLNVPVVCFATLWRGNDIAYECCMPALRRLVLLELFLFYWRFTDTNSAMVKASLRRACDVLAVVVPDVKSLQGDSNGGPPPGTWHLEEWQEALTGIAFVMSIPLTAHRVYAHFKTLGLEALYVAEMCLTFLVCVGNTSIIVLFLLSRPIVTFWAFIIGPVLSLAHARLPKIVIEQLLLVVPFGLWISRCVHSKRVRPLNSPEDSIRRALKHGFRARLAEDFSHTSPMGMMLTRVSSLILGSAKDSVLVKQRELIGIVRGAAEKDGSVGLLGCLDTLARSVCLCVMKERSAGSETLHVRVRREELLEDSVACLLEQWSARGGTPSKVVVRFEGEPAIDAGGPSREWFTALPGELARGSEDPTGDSLFVESQDQSLLPRPSLRGGEEDTETLRKLSAVGRFVALAVILEKPLPFPTSTIMCKYLLGEAVGLQDVRRLDPDFFRNRVEAVLQDEGPQRLEEMLGAPLTFLSAATDVAPAPQELKPGGADLEVTEANKHQYVELLCEHYLCGPIRTELACFLCGFWSLVPCGILRDCRILPQELALMISGVGDLDVQDWRSNTRHPATPDPLAETSSDTESSATTELTTTEMFWAVVDEMTDEERVKLFHFATGLTRLPVGGFERLEPLFSLHFLDNTDLLPTAHTCANQIEVPRYQSKAEMRQKLIVAINLGGGFGFA